MLSVKLNAARNFTENEKIKLIESIKLLEKVVNSDEFKTQVLNYTFIQTNSLTNEQIYNLIMSGKEILQSEIDQEIDIDITIYNAWPWVKTVGYTYPNTVRTWINRIFFKSMSIQEIAGNIMHEWCHKIGFEHSFYWTPSRKDSVPYAIGDIIKNIAPIIK